MKKFVVLMSGIYIFMASSASAFVVTGAAVAAAGAVLVPILAPIAEKLISEVADEIRSSANGEESCFSTCSNPLVICTSSKLLSYCKAKCQKIKRVDSYELKIRFGKNKSGQEWNLIKCVRQGVTSGKKTKQGKGNPKSIAVYSQESLDDLLSLIGMQRAARQIVDTQGKALTDRDLRKAKKTREAIVQESQALIAHIDASIAKNVADGIYGDQ